MTQIALPLTAPAVASRRPSTLAPLRPLTDRQRIGYLDQCSSIVCSASLPGYTAGKVYRLFTATLRVLRYETKRNLMGEPEDVELSAGEMAVFIENNDRQPLCFMSERFKGNGCMIADGTPVSHGFDRLSECFELPNVPDVTALYPEHYAKNLERLKALEGWMQSLDPAFAFREWQTDDLARAAIRDGFILGWATGLGKGLGIFIWPLLKVGWSFTNTGIVPNEPVLIITLGDLRQQFEAEAKKRLGIRTIPLDRTTRALRPGFYLASYTEVTGQERVMQLAREFECIGIDEATKIKAGDSNVSERIRSLNPRCRMLATAQAIKNRLPDIFSLLWWAAGGQPVAHVGFPYRDNFHDRDRFSSSYQVLERNLTKERRSRSGGRKFLRATPEVCNLQRIWKITAPIILRRRKEEVASIVKRISRKVSVPMGLAQAESYRRILEHDWCDEEGRPQTGVKLQKLRQAAACPNSANLGGFASAYDYTPKIAAVMSLTVDIVQRKDQALIFSAFIGTTDCLSRRLGEAGIRHVICDGREDYEARGAMAKAYREGRVPVMLAGEGSMSYGHDFPGIADVILTSKDWAMDLQEQAISRGHRLSSKRDVNVWSVMCEHSIDESVQALLDEKEATSRQVLDAEEWDSDMTEADLNQLLENAAHNFASAKDFEDERKLIKEWKRR